MKNTAFKTPVAVNNHVLMSEGDFQMIKGWQSNVDFRAKTLMQEDGLTFESPEVAYLNGAHAMVTDIIGLMSYPTEETISVGKELSKVTAGISTPMKVALIVGGTYLGYRVYKGVKRELRAQRRGNR